jgi:metal-responsive CopG/Arc/MetJ family transcriptional regulator
MSPVLESKKILVEFPSDLLQATERVADEMGTDRSKVIRYAVKTFLRKRARVRFERELAEAYRVNDELNRKLTEEFDSVNEVF